MECDCLRHCAHAMSAELYFLDDGVVRWRVAAAAAAAVAIYEIREDQ